MIKSFGNKTTADLFGGLHGTKDSRKLPRDILRRATLLLDAIHAAVGLDALRIPPGNRLKELEGSRRGLWSVRINDQWRITFQFKDGDFFHVAIEDYH